MIYDRPTHTEQELELELALEMLEIRTDEELEEFLGKLIRSVGRGLQRFTKSPLGKSITGVLRGVAKQALPLVGGVAGSFVAPGLGSAIGGRLGSMAANLLEAEELEVLSPAEAELEAARRYVRFARSTTRGALNGPRNLPAPVATRRAATAAARRHAPALVRNRSAGGRPTSRPRPGPRPQPRHRPRHRPPRPPYPYAYPYPYPYPVAAYPVGDPYAAAGEPPPWPGPDAPGHPPAALDAGWPPAADGAGRSGGGPDPTDGPADDGTAGSPPADEVGRWTRRAGRIVLDAPAW